MELRNRKLTKYIDSDEYEYENRPRKYHTRSYSSQVAIIKTEPMTFYEPLTRQSTVTLNDLKMEPNEMKVTIETIDSDNDEDTYENVVKRMKVEVNGDDFLDRYRSQLHRRIASKRPHKMRAIPSDGNGKRSYCCYMCGRWFRHFCRAKSHMPMHTGEKIYSCKICDKRYTSTSSVVVHRRTHSGEVAQRTLPICLNRPKEYSTLFRNTQMAGEQPGVAMKEELRKVKRRSVESFTEFQLEPVDFDNVDLSNLEPSITGLDYVPFVWSEHDWEQPVALVSNPKGNFGGREITRTNEVLKENRTDNVMTGDQSTTAKAKQVRNNKASDLIGMDNRPKFLTPRPKSLKLQLWEKETIGSETWFVDILHKPKPKRNLFPSESWNNRSAQPTTETNEPINGKSNELALDYRNFGDIEFMQKNWYDARKWYNRSICYSKWGSPHLAIGYAKRGQCFFNMGMYRQCAVDLKLAEKTGLPTQLLPILERHKSTCAIMLRSSVEEDKVEPKLDFEVDNLFPEMANVIGINYNELHGRHIVAKEAIEVGKIVLVEQGFVATTTDFYERCCICLTGDTNMVPCSKCNKAMLCARCVSRKFHEMECSHQSNGNKLLPKVLRSILMAVTRIPNVEELISFVDAATSGNCPLVPDTIPDFKSKYRAFLQLVYRTKLKAELIPVALEIRTVILKHEFLSRFFGTMKHRRFLSHLILQHIEVISAFGTKTHDDLDKGHIEITAPIASFFNHSCSPNAAKFLLGRTVVVVTMRPIAKGEQLFVSYCNLLQDRKERQSALMSKYGIRCRCERCAPAFVGLDPIQPIDQIRSLLAEKFIIDNFSHLAGENQQIRKEMTEHVLEVLKNFGHLPWNHTTNWAHIVYSMLLSQRFQKKLRY